ncbi:sulfotransferase [Piscinibacter sp.]|uniref:sulfotransferase n=1 Tax=Piscinibacter sp. TaxID=1903157 RepID=UPI002C672DBE|nr:sulfotransferase [Albitalea sp.]HUG25356.1 sulfotransferase [Albitalea sp.]
MAHHRSGSNFLNDLLQKHGCIECLNEPLSMHTRLFRETDLVLWHAGDFDPVLLHRGLTAHDGLRAYLLELRQYLLQSHSGRVIGFKDTCVFGKLGWLKAFLPTLRIIFLRRDPRAIVSSVLRSKMAAFWRYADLVPPAFAQICPRYISRVVPGDTAVRAAETAAMSIATRYELARRTVGSFEHHTLNLDDLMREPARCIAVLTDFLGVEPDPEQTSFIAARQCETRGGLFSSFRSTHDVEATWRRHLSPAQLQVIDDVMRAMREESPIGLPLEVDSA